MDTPHYYDKSPHNDGGILALAIIAYGDIETLPRIVNGALGGSITLKAGKGWESIPLLQDSGTGSGEDEGVGRINERELRFEVAGDFPELSAFWRRWRSRKAVILAMDANRYVRLYGYHGGLSLQRNTDGGSLSGDAPASEFTAIDGGQQDAPYYDYGLPTWGAVNEATPNSYAENVYAEFDDRYIKQVDAVAELGPLFVPVDGNSTINDKKTFEEHPAFPAGNPTAGTDGAHKAYVDQEAAAAEEAANTYTDDELAAQTLNDHADVNVASATEGQVLTKVGSQWLGQTPGSIAFPTGVVWPYVGTTAPTGWILLDDGTIGSASSGASNRANADTEALYTLLWNSMTNTAAPVTGGRGANAAADFAADKPIRLPLALGRAFGVAGAGSGLTSRANGEGVGAETHQLTQGELPNYDLPYTRSGGANNNTMWHRDQNDSLAPGSLDQLQAQGAIQSGGSDQPHNNMQPTAFLNAIIKL